MHGRATKLQKNGKKHVRSG